MAKLARIKRKGFESADFKGAGFMPPVCKDIKIESTPRMLKMVFDSKIIRHKVAQTLRNCLKILL